MRRSWLVIIWGLVSFGFAVGSPGHAQEAVKNPYHYQGPVAEGGVWQADVDFSASSLKTGEELDIDTTLDIDSPGLAYNITKTRGLYCLVTGERLFDGKGQYFGDYGALVSTRLTSSGMPIESEEFRVPHTIFGSKRISPVTSYVRVAPESLRIDKDSGTLVAVFKNKIPVTDEIPSGHYKIRLDFGIEVTPTMRLTLTGTDPASVDAYSPDQSFLQTRLIAINTDASPRMIWTLFSQFHPGGGALAEEDKSIAALSRRHGTFDRCIIPLKDQFGRQVRYLLEPDFPGELNPFLVREIPTIDLNYSSGWVSLRIQTPDGTIINCGSSSFIGPRGMGATTGSESFFFAFSRYGKYMIECKGWIADKYGTVYQGGGVYEIYIAQPIVIEPAAPPGRPIAAGEVYNSGYHIYPPFPAGMRIDAWLESGATKKTEHNSFTIKSSRFGEFVPDVGSSRHRSLNSGAIYFSDPGLYRIQYFAEYKEPDGTMYMGQLESFGVVYDPQVGDNADGTIYPESILPLPVTTKFTNKVYRIEYPQKTGQLVFLPEKNNSFFDPLMSFKPSAFGDIFRGDDDVLVPVGDEKGLCSGTGAALSPMEYYEKLNRIGLQYFSAVRSDGIAQMALAELSPDSETHPHPNPFNSGELPRDAAGDYYLLMGGLHYSDLSTPNHLELPYVAGAYVTTDYADPVYFQAGDIDIENQSGERKMFTGFHAVHPGDILLKGQPYVIDAVAFPNLPSDYEIAISQPDGMVYRRQGSSNRFGFIDNPEQRQPLGMEGVYTISYAVHRGEGSGYPLGTTADNNGTFRVYVIDGGNDNRVNFNLGRVTELDASRATTLRGDVGDSGIATGKAYITIAFQGSLVDEMDVDINDGKLAFDINPKDISAKYTNYSIDDLNDRLDITVFVAGQTSVGKVRFAAEKLYSYGRYLHAIPFKYTEVEAGPKSEREEEGVVNDKKEEYRRGHGPFRR